MKRIITLFFLVLFITQSAFGQITQSDIQYLDNYRLIQISDSTKLPIQSFNIRFSRQINYDSNLAKQGMNHPKFQFTKIGYTIQTNSDLPIGWNDESMYPSIGLQQRATLGARFNWKGLSIQLQPEFVSVNNKPPGDFEVSPWDTNYWPKYYLYNVNKIDNFDRFGTTSFTKIFAGQSSIRYTVNDISIGMSTENLWWGPGTRNSLVMTNNAPGFLHFSLNSVKPIATKWGNVEFQVIYGFLQNSTYEAPENAVMRTIKPAFISNKPQVERNILGYVFNWNPKWTPNLHVGFAGASYFYKSSVTANVNPLVLAYENKSSAAMLGSLFFRYAMPKEQAEVYMEFGRSDKFAHPFNLIGDTIPTGYTAGFRKIFLSSRKKSGILFGIEVTQLQLPDSRLIFNSNNVLDLPKTNSWYTHPFVSQGYTNQGQVMGSSIGPGSNSETVQVSWIKGLKRIGISAERLAHNYDFYYYNYFSGNVGSGIQSFYWVDWNVGINFQWDYKQFLFSGSFMNTSALNYRWVKLDGDYAGPSRSDRSSNFFNFSLHYYFSSTKNIIYFK